jgi:predicted transcriptional regulator
MISSMARITDEALMSSDWPTVKYDDSASMVLDTMASTDAVTLPI